eukprot:m.1637982 g.1637982  ORF g.1637982 m.1637982 type:complete len:344 (+) comp26535_c0_seq1:182-1213(+)
MSSHCRTLALQCVLIAAAAVVEGGWVNVCDLSPNVTFTVTHQGPDTNNPTGTYISSNCYVRMHPCTISSCQGDVPALLATITLSEAFTQVRGTFVEVGNTGSNSADDCNPAAGTTAHTIWGMSQSGHGGITVFGTPEHILYGGCAAGINFGTVGINIVPSTVRLGRELRIEAHQSVIGEIVVYRLSGLEVLVPSTTATTSTTTTDTDPVTTPTATSTTHTIGNHNLRVQQQQIDQDDRIDHLSTRIGTLESQMMDMQQSLNLARLSTPPLSTAAPSSSQCDGSGAAGCIPSVSANGQDVVVNAASGSVKVETSECGVSDICQMSQDIETIKSVLARIGAPTTP